MESFDITPGVCPYGMDIAESTLEQVVQENGVTPAGFTQAIG
jgi:hypothetical protein